MYFLRVLYVVYCLWSSFSLKILQTIRIFGSVSIHYTFKLTSYLFLGSHQQSPRECVQRWLWWDFCSAHIFFAHILYFIFCFILFFIFVLFFVLLVVLRYLGRLARRLSIYVACWPCKASSEYLLFIGNILSFNY